ncbi:MAG: ABC transporter substrate-binding protein [Vicinamibacteria bacterium]|jgi:putative ABC transport system substrate-binding protein
MARTQLARTLAAAALAALAYGAIAQAPPPMTIGVLSSGTYEGRATLDQALMQGLRERGYVEGTNLTVVRRYGASQSKQNAAELATMKLDAVLTTCTPSTRTMQEASATVPIVMAAVSDPVRQKIIDSYAKPGRNVTGTASQDEDLAAKRLEMLVALAPTAKTVAVLANGINPVHALAYPLLEREAKRFGLTTVRYEINSDKLDQAVANAAAAGATALYVMPDDPLMLNLRVRIVELAARYRLPGVYFAREFVDVGGLASYGANLPASYRTAASYILRVKDGAAPAALPVAQPTHFEMVVNERTARALGLGIPPAIRASADVLP